jgi:hypothetical protein
MLSTFERKPPKLLAINKLLNVSYTLKNLVHQWFHFSDHLYTYSLSKIIFINKIIKIFIELLIVYAFAIVCEANQTRIKIVFQLLNLKILK